MSPPLFTHTLVCVCVWENLSLSHVFPPAWVNVRASCCSSQTTQWETDQPHRRGNPLFWLKERVGGREERNFYPSETPLLSWSPSSLCIVAQAWTMWPSSQDSLWLEMRERGTVERDFIKKKKNFQKCNKTAEMLAACQWDTVLLVC